MGRSQREKGKRGERAAAKAVSAMLGVSARRGVQYKGGAESADLEWWPGAGGPAQEEPWGVANHATAGASV
jgi:hypothetical protein